MSRSRFQIAKEDIISCFEDNHDRIIYTYTDISEIFEYNRKFWRMPVNMSTGAFIDLLLKSTKMKKHSFNFPARTIHRFTWADASIYDLALSLDKDAYLSHYTALFIHGLTDQIPKKIYVTHEQPQKDIKKTTLLQSDIDNAFSNAPRMSKNITRFGNYNICLLYGQSTNKLGVSETEFNMSSLMVTGIERTLIDATVRPLYSGGIHEVLTAFTEASKNVSINKLVAMLKKMNYIYPYHQAIGFYMQKTGLYNNLQMHLLKQFDFKYDLYLTHQVGVLDYSREWKIYYPKGF